MRHLFRKATTGESTRRSSTYDHITPETLGVNLFFVCVASIICYFQFSTLWPDQNGHIRFLQIDLPHRKHHHPNPQWALALNEWLGTSPYTKLPVAAGLILLVSQEISIGCAAATSVHTYFLLDLKQAAFGFYQFPLLNGHRQNLRILINYHSKL